MAIHYLSILELEMDFVVGVSSSTIKRGSFYTEPYYSTDVLSLRSQSLVLDYSSKADVRQVGLMLGDFCKE